MAYDFISNNIDYNDNEGKIYKIAGKNIKDISYEHALLQSVRLIDDFEYPMQLFIQKVVEKHLMNTSIEQYENMKNSPMPATLKVATSILQVVSDLCL